MVEERKNLKTNNPYIRHSSQNKEMQYQYNIHKQRSFTQYIDNNSGEYKTKYYVGGNYELEDNNGQERGLNYIYTPDGLVSIVETDKQNEIIATNYIYNDHLGSIYAITDQKGKIINHNDDMQIFSYDAWGNRRAYNKWTKSSTTKFYLFDRGYTGHQMLDEFGIIEMNGRIYDPVIGRFFSPDPFVQSPDNSQNFNRYSYVLNNPLKYTDPSGEFFVLDSWVVGLFSGGWKEANKRAHSDIKIWGGLFVSDPNKAWYNRVWEVTSRFTWQLPQTVGGFLTAHSFNTFGLKGGVASVNYKYGATVVKTRNSGWGGVTQGSFIVGNNKIEANANNPLFQHEYVHYIQSQSMGFAYYSRVGIPSILSKGSHNFKPYEQDANRRAFLYFNENITGFQDDIKHSSYNVRDNRGWDFDRNPLNIDGSNTIGQYVDFQNATHISNLNRLKVQAKWYDYASWLLGPIGPIMVGIINADNYNR